MSDPRYGDEPSMAEILASVRRIVAEEQTPSADSRFEKQIERQEAIAQDELPTDRSSSEDISLSTSSTVDQQVDPIPVTEPFRPETQDIPVASEGSKRSILGRLLERQAQSDAPVETKRPTEDLQPIEMTQSLSTEEEDNVLDLVNPIQASPAVSEPPQPEVAANVEPEVESQAAAIKAEDLDAAVARWASGEGQTVIRTMVREELVALLGAAIKDKA